MNYPPSQKPPIWSIDPGVIAYNCQKAGMPHPVLAMPMWDGAGELARDLSGHGNHGSLSGPTWLNDGLAFNGSTDYVNVGANTSLDAGNNLTISLWAKKDVALLADYEALVVYRESDTSSQYSLYYDSDEKLRFWIYDGAWHDFIGTAQIQDTDWHHIILAWNGSNIWTYIDGSQDNMGAFAYTPNNDTETLRIGNDPMVAGREFEGSINNVSIFDTCLYATQTKFIHNNPYFMYQIPEEMYGYVAAAAIDVYCTLAMSNTLAHSAQANTAAALTLNQIASVADGGQANTEAITTLAEALGVTESALANSLASITLSQSAAITTTAQITADATLALGAGVSISTGATAVTEAALSLANHLAVSQITGQDIDVGITLTQSLGVTDAAQAVADASMILQKIVAVSQSAAVNTAAALSLAYHAALTTASGGTVDAALALAIHQGISATVTLEYGASLALTQSIGITESAQAVAGAGLSLSQNLALVLLAQAVAGAGLSLDAIQSITATATTVLVELVTPEGRTVIITFENRTATISAENRTATILAENRTISMPSAN